MPSVPEALTPDDVMAQVYLIQNVMERAMKKDEHYGVIPGTGNKPTLLKAGAEKLNLTFRMAPDPQVEVIDLGKGHREYRVKVVMTSITSGKILGAGVGSAATMETKWRFRTGPGESTGRSVPTDYWDSRKSDPKKAQEILGGKGFITKKEDGVWMIFRQGEKVEHDNPADYYNTCLKMAKKRALVDAVLTCTAASDIFTQDIEELVDNGVISPSPSSKPAPDPTLDTLKEMNKAGENAVDEAHKAATGEPIISQGKGKLLYALAMSKGMTKDILAMNFKAWYGCELFKLPQTKFEEAKKRLETLPSGSAPADDDQDIPL